MESESIHDDVLRAQQRKGHSRPRKILVHLYRKQHNKMIGEKRWKIEIMWGQKTLKLN